MKFMARTHTHPRPDGEKKIEFDYKLGMVKKFHNCKHRAYYTRTYLLQVKPLIICKTVFYSYSAVRLQPLSHYGESSSIFAQHSCPDNDTQKSMMMNEANTAIHRWRELLVWGHLDATRSQKKGLSFPQPRRAREQGKREVTDGNSLFSPGVQMTQRPQILPTTSGVADPV